MSHRSTQEKELEVQLELYPGIGTFDEMSSDPKNRRFFLFKITRNGQESHKKRCWCFLVFLFFSMIYGVQIPGIVPLQNLDTFVRFTFNHLLRENTEFGPNQI